MAAYFRAKLNSIMAYRTNNCGELTIEHLGQKVVLAGWVQRVRELGGMTFLDLRDRYGITQLAFNDGWDELLMANARKFGRRCYTG